MEVLPSYEKLGAFYLGKKYDLATRQLLSEEVLYDSKDLTTHALCVGMTGSGKTGLCLALLEEAALDNVPAICIDPKGDLGNLLLSFPELRPDNFREYLDEEEAVRQGISIDQLAQQTAEKWKKGLAQWNQTPDRIERFRQSVDISIFTPGSNIGIPLTVLRSFDAPPQAVRDDAETFREKVTSSASGLLTLLGMEADPLNSREHILLSTILSRTWMAGKNLDLGQLIRQIQSPEGIDRIGVLDLDSFLSPEQRSQFAMSLNNLLAAPAFAGWLTGEPLDIKRLLYTPEAKPRLSIISIAHLSDAERMFFVTIFLGELLAWTRAQPGTSSLRAIFYMDEVYGYFPPSAKPPSKPPMLTLLKQARAFGVGIVLATQNPVDLDYKGLSNMGTWFLGRLQTARDKERVLEGLEGAAAQAGQRFDRQAMDSTLSALGSRIFLLNNVHEDAPVVFQSRWALSFLRGPLSRAQIQKLMQDKRATEAHGRQAQTGSGQGQAPSGTSRDADDGSGTKKIASHLPTAGARPIVPPEITERFWVAARRPTAGARIFYQPAILAQASVHYVKANLNIDAWRDVAILVDAARAVDSSIWQAAVDVPPSDIDLETTPDDEASFADLPASLLSPKNFSAWEKQLKDHLFRHCFGRIFYSPSLDRASRLDQDELEARMELTQAAREKRDQEVDKLKQKFATKIKALEARILTAQQRVAKEKEQRTQQTLQSMLNFGTSIAGALLGRKLMSKANMSKVATTARTFGRAAQEHGDVARATDSLEELQAERAAFEKQSQDEIDRVRSMFSPEGLTLETVELPLRKADTRIKSIALVWIPWQKDAQNVVKPLVDLPKAF